MIHSYLLHNDEIRSSTDRMLSPGQVGLLAGWGVFSTIRVYAGTLFAFEHHWRRMQRDAKLLRVPFPDDPGRFEEALLRLVEANQAPNCTLRVIVARNRGGLWEGPGVSGDFDVIGLTADVNSWGSAVRLDLVPQGRHAGSPFSGTKVLSWANNLTWYEKAHEDGFDEVVLLNERGEVAECTSANVFAVFGNQVFTPPLSSGCLAGITRHTLLNEAKISEFAVSERTLMPEDLSRADEVFITSTTRELMRVEHIEGLSIRSRGEARRALQAAFSRYVDLYVGDATRRRSSWARV